MSFTLENQVKHTSNNGNYSCDGEMPLSGGVVT